MDNKANNLSIAVLEDSDFYNKILTRRLHNYTSELAIMIGFNFRIDAYSHADDFIRNLNTDLDIAFVDYHLGPGLNCLHVLRKIRELCNHCRLVVISRLDNIQSIIHARMNGEADFLFKDRYAIPKSCLIVEDEASRLFRKKLKN